MPVSSTQPVFPPPSGSPIQSVWGQAVSEHVIQKFQNVADRDANWTNPPNGALCVCLNTAGNEIWYRRTAGVWCMEAGDLPWCTHNLGGPMTISNNQWTVPWAKYEGNAGFGNPGGGTAVPVPVKGLYFVSLIMNFGTGGPATGIFASWFNAGDGIRRLTSAGIPNAIGTMSIGESGVFVMNAGNITTSIFMNGVSGTVDMGAGPSGSQMHMTLLRQVP